MTDDDIEAFTWRLLDGREADCTQVIEQRYRNCRFSAGVVDGLEHEDVYLRIDKDGQEPTIFFFRKDEAQAVNWVISGTLWSLEVGLVKDDEN